MEFGAPPVLCASAATGGKKETEGPLAPYFDILNKDTKFRQDSWEKAESRMQQETLRTALEKRKLTGAVSHFAIGGAPDWTVFALCVLFTLVWARIAAVFANKASPKTLNRATGVVLVILGVVIMLFNVQA